MPASRTDVACWPGADVDPGVKSARGFDIQFFSANSTTDPCEPVNGVIDLAEDDGATSAHDCKSEVARLRRRTPGGVVVRKSHDQRYGPNQSNL